MINVYPSILTGELPEAAAQIQAVQSLPQVRVVQIDVIDGQFVDNLTLTPSDFCGIAFGELSADLHLLTEEPVDFVYEMIEHKDHFPVRAVIGQVERMSSQSFFLETVSKNEWQAGLSLDIATPLEEIDDSSWSQLSIVQLMSIEAGFQGQEFQPQVLNKIDALAKLAREHKRDIEIIIDGAVSAQTISELAEHDIDSVVVGSALWQADDFEATIANLANPQAE